eukprot:TRINITY_DN4812_c0_g1_i1.p1 TRINITY_DN4812_c0_g1~~TRINITY_DN4812_c0_g1_i1.p1  ORF type:complete len:117 (+),score=23.67 TRINITY_DN4812_c0_g1_i1:94-444(+)
MLYEIDGLARGIDDCDKAIKLKPDYIKAYTRKGRTQHFLKEYHKAIETYDAGLKHDPTNADLQDDKRRTMLAIDQENSSGNVDPKRAEAAMRDPAIREILPRPKNNDYLKECTIQS